MNITAGLKKAATVKGATEAAAAGAGLAATGFLEAEVFSALPDVFGTNSGEGSLTQSHQIARGVFRAAEAFTGLALVSQGRGVTRAAGYGVTAGGAWHLLRDLLDL